MYANTFNVLGQKILYPKTSKVDFGAFSKENVEDFQGRKAAAALSE